MDSSSANLKYPSFSAAEFSSIDKNGMVNNSKECIHSPVLPPAFVEDPAGFLTSIASRSNPSPDGISLLAGPLSRWFRNAEESHRRFRDTSSNKNAQITVTAQDAGVHLTAHIAQLYLCAAASQLREGHQSRAICSGESAVTADMLISTSTVSNTAPSSNMIARERQENKNLNARLRDETIEAVAAAASLCSDRSAISSSGILPVLGNIVTSTTSLNPGNSLSIHASCGSNNVASSIATSLSNLPLSSSKSFPPLTPVHIAFLQSAIIAEQFKFAESVIRDTWPLPAYILKYDQEIDNHDSHNSITFFLRYYYLRGIIYYGCGRDHYSLAHRCWWTCLSIPVDPMSHIAIQAWKKLTLVQPLLDINGNSQEGVRSDRSNLIYTDIDENGFITFAGSSAPVTTSKKKRKTQTGTRIPNCTPNGLSKSIRALIATNNVGKRDRENAQMEILKCREKDFFSVYLQLGPAVEAMDRATVESLLRTYESILTADGNLDMARNCLSRVKELQVQTASKMFTVSSIPILARRWNVTPQDASQQLSDAMELGVVPCRVEKDKTVVFTSPVDSVSTRADTNLSELMSWIKLYQKMRQVEIHLSISSKSNAVKRTKDKDTIAERIGSVGPRGVEDFYGKSIM